MALPREDSTWFEDCAIYLSSYYGWIEEGNKNFSVGIAGLPGSVLSDIAGAAREMLDGVGNPRSSDHGVDLELEVEDDFWRSNTR